MFIEDKNLDVNSKKLNLALKIKNMKLTPVKPLLQL